MHARLLPAVLLLAAIVCTGEHRAGAQAIRVNPGIGQTPGGIGGVGAVGSSGLGSGLNTGLGPGSGLNIDLGTSLRGTLPSPTPAPVETSVGSEQWGTSPSHDDDSPDRPSESIHVNHPSRDQDQDDYLSSSDSHATVSAGGDPPDPPDSGDDGGGDEDNEDDEDEGEGSGIPWFWIVLGVVALVVIFRR